MALTERLTQEVIEIVAGIAERDPGQVSATASLEELGIDSLDGLRIVAAVEKRYGIVIDEAQINAIRSMTDIVALIREYAPDVR